MRLRGYERGDLAAIFALDEICFAPPFRFTLTAMRRFAEARHALTVIVERDSEQGTQIVGFCIAHVEREGETRVSYVVTLDVAPGVRRQGLAQRMMERIEEQARAVGCGAMALHVSVENEGAIRFYERMRYLRSHVTESFYGRGRDAFVYRKVLGGSPASS
jgi:ribosomal-protein-alanine N-acetyltransferase